MDDKESGVKFYFYIDKKRWPKAEIPQDMDNFWGWLCSSTEPRWRGVYCWIIQTYLHLKMSGFPCEITDELPSEGVVIAHTFSLSRRLRSKKNRILVCILSDKLYAAPHLVNRYANLYVVQNPLQTKDIGNSIFIPYWPQPNLIPRDPGRGDKFENISFFGYGMDDKIIRDVCVDLGLEFNKFNRNYREKWNDYSFTDAIVAVRDFSEGHISKPANKLYNAWLSGVPAILGPESAYRAERKSELDYIEVKSEEEIFTALKRLRDDNDLRRRMVENGRVRAREITPGKITERWKDFLLNRALPALQEWSAASFFKRSVFYLKRRQKYGTK